MLFLFWEGVGVEKILNGKWWKESVCAKIGRKTNAKE
jgi:hypothetical protein